MNETLLPYWILCTATLFIKMWANSLVQGYHRITNKHFSLPEDAAFFAQIEPKPEEHSMVQRAAGCWRNDLENIPIFLLLALGYVLIGGNTNAGIAYFSIFVICRIMHTILYLKSEQPWRTVAYATGLLTTLIILIHSAAAAWL